MTSYEERRELIETADRLREELKRTNAAANIVINKLLTEADALMFASADEVEKGESVTKKIVTYGARTAGASRLAEPITTEQVTEIPRVPLPAGKRACSKCHQPGHRATTCPNAHILRARDKAEKEARPTPPPKEPGKRYCGNCGFPGHRSQNCTVPPKPKRGKR